MLQLVLFLNYISTCMISSLIMLSIVFLFVLCSDWKNPLLPFLNELRRSLYFFKISSWTFFNLQCFISWCGETCQRLYGGCKEAPALFHRSAAGGSTNQRRTAQEGIYGQFVMYVLNLILDIFCETRVWFIGCWRLIGYCCDGRRAENEEWAYQEARKTDSRMEEGITRPVRKAQSWVREGMILIG